MLNKFRRFIRKHSSLSVLIISGLTALGLEQINKYATAHVLLIAVSAFVLIPSLAAMNNTLRHGFYGIHILPVTSLVFALILGHYWAAFIVALILCSEKPWITLLSKTSKAERTTGRSVSFTSINHAPFVRLLDRYSVSLSILVLLIGGGIWVVTGDVQRMLEVLLVATSTPLIVAPMVAFRAGLNQARNNGINIKSASVFEILASARAVVMSKTGIITDKNVKIAGIQALPGNTKDTVLTTAASLASGSDHYLARAIVSEAELKINKAKHAREMPGMGIAGRLRGQDLYIGRKEFLAQSGVTIPDSLKEPQQTAVYVAVGDKMLGIITFTETYLPNTKNISSVLKKLSISSTVLVSGAAHGAAKAAATHAGIKTVKAECTQTDKILTIDNVTDRPVVYVGDAEKDAAALTAADVSISPNEGADIVITDWSATTMINSLKLSKHSLKHARTVSLAGLFATLLFVTLASSGILTPLQCAGLQLLTVLASTTLAAKTKKLQRSQ